MVSTNQYVSKKIVKFLTHMSTGSISMLNMSHSEEEKEEGGNNSPSTEILMWLTTSW